MLRRRFEWKIRGRTLQLGERTLMWADLHRTAASKVVYGNPPDFPEMLVWRRHLRPGLIFLRHFGCSFCRQAISDVADVRQQLAARNVRPVFVHLGTPDRTPSR